MGSAAESSVQKDEAWIFVDGKRTSDEDEGKNDGSDDGQTTLSRCQAPYVTQSLPTSHNCPFIARRYKQSISG